MKLLPRRSPSEQLLKDAHDAMTDALASWMQPDSPEAVVVDMKALMVIRDRIAARLGLPESKTSQQP